MNAAPTNQIRDFPAYTTQELKGVIKRFDRGGFTFTRAETISQVKIEVANREARNLE